VCIIINIYYTLKFIIHNIHLGDEKEKKKLKAEFEKELYNLITVNETIKINSLNKDIIKVKKSEKRIIIIYCIMLSFNYFTDSFKTTSLEYLC